MREPFLREKEQILSQYILNHFVTDEEVGELEERLDKVVETAERLHRGQKRKTGEEYIWHPVRTAMEVSRFGRIVDWASIEAAILHDTVEDTDYTYEQIRRDYPDAADLVAALTKIKDNVVLTYTRLFSYVLQDIRVLLIKLSDRLDNLDSLGVFPREKQVRIARESAEMYANICSRLCMRDLAGKLNERIADFLYPEELSKFRAAQADLKKEWKRPLEDLRRRLAKVFPGDITARIEMHWNRFQPGVSPTPENLFTAWIITERDEDVYTALGRVHTNFPAMPKTFSDTISVPMKNGFRAIETRVSYRGRMVSFYIASRSMDRFNRMGLLSMDLTSPEFNMDYLDDLREFLENDDMEMQDFLQFNRPDSIQVTSPKGQVFCLEEGTTALDYAFAVHEQLGLRALSARINDMDAQLGTELKSGDVVSIIEGSRPSFSEQHLKWATTRKAITSLRRKLRRETAAKAANTGREWFVEATVGKGLSEEEGLALAQDRARTLKIDLDTLFQHICMGDMDIGSVLGDTPAPPSKLPGSSILSRFTGKRQHTRKVRRYNFNDPHIRFCAKCVPLEGDDIVGTPDKGRLIVHRSNCAVAPINSNLPLAWDKVNRRDLRDPGIVELELKVTEGQGLLYVILAPFSEMGIDIMNLTMPSGERPLRVRFAPGSTRSLDKIAHALRRLPTVFSLSVQQGETKSDSREKA